MHENSNPDTCISPQITQYFSKVIGVHLIMKTAQHSQNDGAKILWLKMVQLQLKHLLEFHAQGDHQTKSVSLRTTIRYLKPKAIYIKLSCLHFDTSSDLLFKMNRLSAFRMESFLEVHKLQLLLPLLHEFACFKIDQLL